MCQAGDAVKTSNDSSSKENKVEEVPCIVKFRPCKDWRGEYGFDWVREGKQDFYKERTNLGGNDETAFANPLKEKMGDNAYKKWKEEVELELLKRYHNNPAFDIQEAKAAKFRKKAEEYDLLCSYDPDAWKQQYYESGEKSVEEKYAKSDNPIEYLYHPKYVDGITYHSYNGVWVIEYFNYEDELNGFREAESSLEVMRGYVDINGEKYSVIYLGNTVYYPLYTDVSDQAFPELDNRVSKKIISYRKGNWDVTITYTIKGIKLSVSLHKNKSEEKTIKSELWYDYSKLRYFTTDSRIIDIDELLESEIEFYSRLKEIHELRADEKEFFLKLKDAYFTSDIRNNHNMDIAHLSDDSSLVDVKVTIWSPRSIVKYKIPIDIVKEQVNNKVRVFWKGYPIYTWKEDYEDSFRHRWFHRPGKDNIKYCVPVLSMANFPFEKTRFVMNTGLDAPITNRIPWDEAPIQLFIEGDCPKLILKPMMGLHEMDGIIELSRKEISNPSNIEEITIKIPSERDYSHAVVKLEAFCEYPDNSKTHVSVGELYVQILNKGQFHLTRVMLKKEGEVIPGMDEVLKVQTAMLINSLAQCGIKLKYCPVTLIIDKETQKELYWDEDNWIKAELIALDLLRRKYPSCHFDVSAPFFISNSKFMFAGVNISGYHNEGTKINLLFSNIFIYRGQFQVFAHEVGHLLSNAHYFQRFSSTSPQPYCFEIGTSSNIMDYHNVGYSYHRFNWERMADELEKVEKERTSRIKNRIKSKITRERVLESGKQRDGYI